MIFQASWAGRHTRRDFFQRAESGRHMIGDFPKGRTGPAKREISFLTEKEMKTNNKEMKTNNIASQSGSTKQ